MQIIHDIWGATHTAAALVALITGAFVLVRPKGDGQHKLTGYTYFVAFWMLILAGLPMASDGISIFHWLSGVSAVTLLAGLSLILRARRERDPAKRAGLIFGHYKFMAWSYIGLVAAGVAQVSSRLAVALGGMSTFWWAVALASFSAAAFGAVWIARSDRGVIRRYARALDAQLS